MLNRSRKFVPLVLALITAAAMYPGGWAVISVEALPDYVVATQPVELTFTVLQHGKTPLSGLKPRLDATAPGIDVTTFATAGKGRGQYRATLALPSAGQWTITIHSGFHDSKLTLQPLTAIAAGATAPAVSDAERGRQLFAAKGCVGCHVHGAVNGQSVPVGPDLTARRYEPVYLKKLLADPASVLARRVGTAEMPNLGLEPGEIAALAAFINNEKQVGQR